MISYVAIPNLDSMESIDKFFYASLAGTVGAIVLLLVLLIRQIDYYSSNLGQALILVILFLAMLGGFYLYFNARMGTGVFGPA